MMVGRFAEVCRRRGLKVNEDKSKVMVLNGKMGVDCEALVDGTWFGDVSRFIYLGCVLDQSCADEAECRRKMGSGKKVAGGCFKIPGECYQFAA